jgi:hypothetical protein
LLFLCVIHLSNFSKAQYTVYTNRTAWEAALAGTASNADFSSLTSDVDICASNVTAGSYTLTKVSCSGSISLDVSDNGSSGLFSGVDQINLGGTTRGTPKIQFSIPTSYAVAFDWKTTAITNPNPYNSFWIEFTTSSGSFSYNMNASATSGFFGVVSKCGAITSYNLYSPRTNFQGFSATNFSHCTAAYSAIQPSTPTVNSTSTVNCGAVSTTLSIASGNLNDATNWVWYTGSCNSGTQVGTGTSIIVAPTSTETYYLRGEGGCVSPGNCGSLTVTVTGAKAPTGANVYSGNVTISTQTQMDAFFNNSNGEKWTKITGLLTLNGNNYSDPINSLCNLSSLVEITGNLNINSFNKAANPTTLSQLASLTTLGCGLNITSNALLQDATLTGLSSIGCSVNISDNGALRILNLPSLAGVQGGQFSIKNNSKLELASASTNVSSFSFTGKGSNIEISDNGSSAAQNLTMNFKKITYLNGTLNFTNNDNAGVSSFDDIFSGLNNMSVKWGKVIITNNDYLSTCCIAASVIIGGSGNRHIISGNTGNCVDSLTVLANCGAFHKKSMSPTTGLTNAFVEYNVFPNPSSGTFNLDVMSNQSGQLNLTITDLMGRTILTDSHAISQFTSLPISLTSAASGTYFLKAEMNGEVFVKRIVLNK